MNEYFFGFLHTSGLDPITSVFVFILYFIPYSVLPLLLVIFLIKIIFAKKLKFALFNPFIFSVLLLSLFTGLLWNKFIFNNLYYQEDPTNFPILLLFHETAYPHPASWLIGDWSLFSIDLIFFVILILVYGLSYLISLNWVKKDNNNLSSYNGTTAFSGLILLLLAVGCSLWVNNYNHLNSKFAFYQSKDCAQIEKINEYKTGCLIETHTVGIRPTVNWLGNYLRDQVKVFGESDKARGFNLPKDPALWDCAFDGRVIENISNINTVDNLHLEENKIYKCWPK